jgi:two-component system response regulator HydG
MTANSDLRDRLVGESSALREVEAFIDRAAPSGTTVLVEGASGTGKERVARALHSRSRRSSGPFVAVNCAALPETLLETELFGHERGAFTGAVTRRAGRFEQAGGGTLFLDEIGELPSPAQAKLLRALEEREIDRIGGLGPIPIDIRLVAATHRDLEAAICDGKFREDLYYRLNVLRVRMPSLAERREDIPMLAEHFLMELRDISDRHITGFSAEALRALQWHDWPGNVRELRNAVEAAIVLGTGSEIGRNDLPGEIWGGSVPESGACHRHSPYQDAVRETKRILLRAAFARAEGDYKRAASALGIHPRTIHRILRRLDLTDLLGRRER